jgi:hypothetical protein
MFSFVLNIYIRNNKPPTVILSLNKITVWSVDAKNFIIRNYGG